MKKKWLAFTALFAFALLSSASLYAQQITRFAVVDTSRVYQAYYRDSAPVRNYESRRDEFKKELDRLTTELQSLNDQKIEYTRQGNETQALRLEAQITQQTDYITEYTNAKNIELESLRRTLQNNNAFYQRLYETLEQIAETGGYTMILNLQESDSILWYSSSVDITDQVITQLGLM